jgi:hypothetical protein
VRFNWRKKTIHNDTLKNPWEKVVYLIVEESVIKSFKSNGKTMTITIE